jgi:general secretion pathway protein A
VSTAGASKGYDSLFGSFGLKENPFHVSPDPRFLFSGPAYQTAIAELMFGVQSRRGLHVLTGEAGTGKTTLMRHFLQWLADRHYSSSYVFHSHLAPTELFEVILRDFGVPTDSTKKTDLVATLHQWLLARQAAGDTPVLIIDEAQALSIRTLSELRMLLNLENSSGKLLQIVLAGQPELVEKLHRPELGALRQRMMVHCRLPILTLEDTAEYINTRLRGAGAADPQIFSADTVQTLYSFARGIPRVTNLLCERAMVGAYAEQHTVVSSADVRKVAAEYDLEGEAGPTALIDLALPRPQRVPAAIAKTLPAVEPKSVVESPTTAPDAAPIAPVRPALPAMPAHASAASLVTNPVPAVRNVRPAAPAPQPARPRDKNATEFIVEFCLDSAEPQESPKIVSGSNWRKYQPENPFAQFWSDVSKSFRKDARKLYSTVALRVKSFTRKIRVPRVDVHRIYRSAAPPVQAFVRSIRLPKLDMRRKLFAPLRGWLRRPIHSNRPPVSGRVSPSPRPGKS